jgi:nucleoside-diphosphate kinase
MERTFIIVKPDAVQRGLTGEIISRFERRGLKSVAIRMIQAERATVEEHYAEHKGKGFYEGLVNYLMSGPIVIVALEGKNAIKAARQTIGATRPMEADVGTIRGDLALEVGRNLVHGSDGTESAARELGLWFSDSDYVAHTRPGEEWIYE